MIALTEARLCRCPHSPLAGDCRTGNSVRCSASAVNHHRFVGSTTFRGNSTYVGGAIYIDEGDWETPVINYPEDLADLVFEDNRVNVSFSSQASPASMSITL